MVIPNEWVEGAIGALFSFHRTVALSRAQLSDAGEIGYIHYGDIHAKWGTHLDLSREALPRVEGGLAATAAPVADGDLVLADASEDIEGVGRGIEICGVSGQKVIAGLHTVLLRPQAGLFAPRFVGYLPQTPEFRMQATTLAAGLKVYGLSKSSLRQIVVRVPPLKEQEAIAEALVDADAVIEALDALIAKKRDVKQAAMQQLLTGRTRLPGFSEEWAVQHLGRILSLEYGAPLKEVDRSGSGFPVMASAGVVGYHRTALVEDDAAVVVGRKGTAGAVYWSSSPCWPIDTAYYVKTRYPTDLRWLFYLLGESKLSSLAEQTGVPGLNRDRVYEREVLMPERVEEQAKIAEVLSDMDSYIDALVAQRDKMRLVKQGMMQELLSSRVRLV